MCRHGSSQLGLLPCFLHSATKKLVACSMLEAAVTVTAHMAWHLPPHAQCQDMAAVAELPPTWLATIAAQCVCGSGPGPASPKH
jgi:hypothetical protein